MGKFLMDKISLLLAEKRCSQCLTTKARIVSGERAAEIVKSCRRDDSHFICHKASEVGLNVHYRGVHEIVKGKTFRFAEALGIPIKEVDTESLVVSA
jgi:hypothetical protein